MAETSVGTNDNESLLDRDSFVEFARTKLLKRSSLLKEIFSVMCIRTKEQRRIAGLWCYVTIDFGKAIFF